MNVIRLQTLKLQTHKGVRAVEERGDRMRQCEKGQSTERARGRLDAELREKHSSYEPDKRRWNSLSSWT